MSEAVYLECWARAAAALFSQALAGEPELVDALPKPIASSAPCFVARIAGGLEGRFAVMLDPELLETALLGEGVEARTAWGELLREVAESAIGELLARTGIKCRIVAFEEASAEPQITRAFQLKAGDRSWPIMVREELQATASERSTDTEKVIENPIKILPIQSGRPGLDLLLDVELEATLRFGCCELPLAEILSLGPGDVVQLDRHISAPVDLIVGDKIVAQGEVVLVNGNFGLRVTEVAAPLQRLEGVRCLF